MGIVAERGFGSLACAGLNGRAEFLGCEGGQRLPLAVERLPAEPHQDADGVDDREEVDQDRPRCPDCAHLMRFMLTSGIMRTTIDLDGPILRELKRLQKSEGKSLGRLVSDLLASALAHRKSARSRPASFAWVSRPMGARVDLRDKDAVQAILDSSSSERSSPSS